MAQGKREKWYLLMQEYERSGKSVSEWCAESGFTYHTFRYWRYRVRIQETYGGGEARVPAGWIKVALPASPQEDGLTIRIGGATIAVARGFDRQLLREVVASLT